MKGSCFNVYPTCRGHNFPVWDVASSPHGYYFASASADKTARMWCTERTNPLRIFTGLLKSLVMCHWFPTCCDCICHCYAVRTSHIGCVFKVKYHLAMRGLVLPLLKDCMGSGCRHLLLLTGSGPPEQGCLACQFPRTTSNNALHMLTCRLPWVQQVECNLVLTSLEES